MSCKYLCQVGALKFASPRSDRCEFPAGACVIERFWGSGLLPRPLPRPGHQRCARALPPLPLRDPVIERSEHGIYFGRTSEGSRWRETDTRTEKEVAPDSVFRFFFFFLNQQAKITAFSVLIRALMWLQINVHTAGVWPKTFIVLIW